MKDNNLKYELLSYDAIIKALFENYESIYIVDAETSEYKCFHESDSYSSLCLESEGDDFFEALKANILRTIYVNDQEYVRKKLTKEALASGLKKDKFYTFVYRLMIREKPLYHKFRATKDFVDGRMSYLIGIRDVDKAFRQDKAQAREISSMHSKELTHLEAILASAEGYMEANLSKDIILEMSQHIVPSPLPDNIIHPKANDIMIYSSFEKWRLNNLIVENKEQYRKISNREYLINCFEKGDKRASVSFSVRTASGHKQPCKEVFYLYRDVTTNEIFSFCVLYDLTEQQRQEKELRELEKELQYSRLRNFTSQMQPHFLYNALGSIQEVVLDDPEYAANLIGDFTIHLRSCIRAMANDDLIPFEQELDNIKAYVNIEKMRFGEKLKVEYKIDLKDFSILPLSVQPIVENAIRHGIYERGEKGGRVIISTANTADSIRVTVEDNGVGFDVAKIRKNNGEENTDSTGLKNIMFRLEKMMNATVNITSVLEVGTTVTINIPKERRGNESNNNR